MSAFFGIGAGAKALEKTGFFKDTKSSVEQIDLLTPEQKQAIASALNISIEKLPEVFANLGSNINENQQFQEGAGTLTSLLQDFDPAATRESFERGVADPARQSFERQTVPQIAERFAGANALSSSALTGQLTQAGADLEGSLAGTLAQMLQQGELNKQQVQSQAVGSALQFAVTPDAVQAQQQQSLLNLMNAGLTQEFQPMFKPGKPSLFSQFASTAINAAGSAAGSAAVGGF